MLFNIPVRPAPSSEIPPMARPPFAAALAALLIASAGTAQPPDGEKKLPPRIGHMVYFKLKEQTPAARQKLIDACDKYLSKHAGTVFYSAGPIAKEFDREVNDTDWDVALHLVFRDKAAHDGYQDHPDHIKFIDENKATWAKVRVFDSALPPAKAKTPAK
jgi:hypothetical protein